MEYRANELSDAVVRSLAYTSNPRLKEILVELVGSLHGFVRKTNLTFEEWEYAIDFLTRTGQKCSDTRQEFILLSDVLGVSMLVDALGHADRAGATDTTVLGPFYVGEHKPTPHGSNIAAGLRGKPMFVEARVSDVSGHPIANAAIDVWHADDDGFYDSQKESYATQGASLRARFISDAQGNFSFRTILPRSYPIPTDGPVGDLLRATGRHPMRPAHVHFLINAPGYEPLITHLFLEGDEYLESDAVFGVKNDLVLAVQEHTTSMMPDQSPSTGPWYLMTYNFHLKPGAGSAPRPLAAPTL
jgi:protocatechuate 3,4-dioxygenase beta subunit